MTGAIEFLRKSKAIDNLDDKEKVVMSLIDYIYNMDKTNEAELVRKVMAYQIKEAPNEQN